MTPTIKDIAREAQVSYATVSRALNGKYGVRPATRKRILEIARSLNYTPNAIARGLVTRRTRTIGLILPDITNPFFPEVARGVEEEAQRRRYSVFLCNTNWERSREREYVRLLAQKRVDGLIIAPISNSGGELEEVPEGVGVVYVSNVPRTTRRSYVQIDNVRGGYLATRHLLDAGFERIAFIGAVEGAQSANERLEGYRLAFAESGVALEERYVHLGHFRQETGYRVIRDMIDSGDCPQAVFAENDIIALGVLQGVREAGLRVPADVAVVGFDDIAFASFRDIQLTTVYQPKYELGKLAVQMLLEETGGGADARQEAGSTGGRKIILEPRLIVRGTSPGRGQEPDHDPAAGSHSGGIEGRAEPHSGTARAGQMREEIRSVRDRVGESTRRQSL